MEPQTPSSWLGAAVRWAVLVGLTYGFWRWLAGYLLPFIVAMVVAVAVEPLADWLEQNGLSEAWAGLLSLGVGLGGASAALALTVAVLARELYHLAAVLPRWGALAPGTATHWMGAVEQWSRAVGMGPAVWGRDWSGLTRLLEQGIVQALALVGRLPDGILTAVVAVVAAFFLLRDRHRAGRWVARWLPGGHHSRWWGVQTAMVSGTVGFLKAQLALIGLTAATTTAGLALIGSPWALVAGLAAGLLDLVPFLGPTALLAPWAVVLFAMGQVAEALEVGAVLLGVALVRQMVEPRLVGAGTGLHPLLALLAVYVGIRLFGPAGFFVGPVSAVVLKALAPLVRVPPKAA
ncbi:MAG: AI-2E family transporter [Firmicutes bacterium]|nr:AI-2E family transporter [Alicyclobacillaceae bacterium]MCL6496807.1 AI-2E family transporter [Bacillota bacterium]